MTQRQIEKWLEAERTEFEKSCNTDNTIPQSFGVIADMYFNNMARHKIRDTTYDNYSTQLPRIREALGKIRIDKLTDYDIQCFINDLSDGKIDGKPKAHGTCDNAKAIISNVCKLAKSLGMIAVNPVETVKLPEKIHKEKDIYTREEVVWLLKSLENYNNEQLRLWVNLAATTGMRTGEILGLEWSDVSFDTNTIYIHQQLVKTNAKGLHIFGTKNRKNRTVTVPHNVIEMLKVWKQKSISNMVFYNEEDGSYCPKYRPRNWLAMFCRKTGFRYCSPHSFRHFYATTLLTDGVPVATVARVIGDKIKTVFDNYVHAESGAENRACSAIENALKNVSVSFGEKLGIEEKKTT